MKGHFLSKFSTAIQVLQTEFASDLPVLMLLFIPVCKLWYWVSFLIGNIALAECLDHWLWHSFLFVWTLASNDWQAWGAEPRDSFQAQCKPGKLLVHLFIRQYWKYSLHLAVHEGNGELHSVPVTLYTLGGHFPLTDSLCNLQFSMTCLFKIIGSINPLKIWRKRGSPM